MWLLLTHARLWDGTLSPVQPDVDLLIRDDRIAEIGADLVAPEGATTIDLGGSTVIPGLVDAHEHLSMDPGAAWRETTPEHHAELLAWHLRALVACGVTTILDPAVLPDDLAQIRATLAAGKPGPRYLALGTPFSPKGGYVSAVIPAFPSVSTPAEVEAQFDRLATEDLQGIKVTVEQGFGPRIWPLYPPEVRAAIVSGAASRGLPIFAHAMSPAEQTLAIDELHAAVLVHGLDRPDAATVALVGHAGVTEISTLSVYDGDAIGWEPARLDDPLFQLTVPPEELATARDPEVVRGFARDLVATVYPHVPFKSAVAGSALIRQQTERRTRRAEAGIRALSEADVPVVMGSDSGNWPVIPYLFHGPTSIREVELLGEAGLTPTQALTAATRAAATMLQLEDEIGTVQPGRMADLVVVDGDPLTDLSALRHLRLVVRAGVARTPAEWMAQ